MFLRIVRVRSTEQSGIKGVKIPFDPNIFVTEKVRNSSPDSFNGLIVSRRREKLTHIRVMRGDKSDILAYT